MITKKTLLYNFIFGASTDTKIKTYYHLLEPLFHTMSDHNMYLNLGYHDKNESFPNSIVTTQKNMVENVTRDFNKSGLWLDVGCGTGAPACYLSKMYDDIEIEGINIVENQIVKARLLAEQKEVNDKVQFLFGDACNMYSENESYDNIYAIESAFHFENKLKFITEAHRTLKPDGKIAIADIVYKPELAKITDFYKVAIAKHGLATKEFYSEEKWTSLLKKQNFKDIIIEDITINVASVLPEWIKLIKTNEHKLLPLYPKTFLTMLCKCLQYAADKKENSIFGYVIIRAKK